MEGIQKHSKDLKLCRNQAPKPPITSTFESQEHLKKNNSSHPSRSQSSLESSSKISINTKRLQISGALRIQASKAPKNFHYKSLKTKNIHPNYSYKSQSSTGIKLQSLQKLQDFDPLKLHRIQALNSQRTFTTNLQRLRTFKEPTKNKKSLTSIQLESHRNFVPKNFQSNFLSKWRTSCVQVKTTST